MKLVTSTVLLALAVVLAPVVAADRTEAPAQAGGKSLYERLGGVFATEPVNDIETQRAT